MDLQDGDEARAIAAAAEAENEDVEVTESLGYITVRCPNRLVIRQEAVEEALGRPWNPRDLQALLSAYAGNITSAGQNGRWVLEWLGRDQKPEATSDTSDSREASV
ncbi:MAG: MmoB/DmpM family protein [Actinomycetota bacterium]